MTMVYLFGVTFCLELVFGVYCGCMGELAYSLTCDMHFGVCNCIGGCVELCLGPAMYWFELQSINLCSCVFGSTGYVLHVSSTHYLIANLGGCVPTFLMFGAALKYVLSCFRSNLSSGLDCFHHNMYLRLICWDLCQFHILDNLI